ncbi:hypothetical protein GCM10009854_47030 [Saccharopolyspora halophila]|uniref:Alanine-rich protein n=1 Tax=Saccharopolyspora halophila TaxID=405551 RepID=A0ABN3GWG5_9PSEU
MRAHVTGYGYPWDVDAGFVDRAAAAGVDEVAIAVSYHSARAATPHSAERSSVVAAHSALYRPVGTGWGRLRPAAPDWVAGQDSAGDAVGALQRAGVPAAAWVVLTHNSLLGARFPDVAVRNCFDERYPWALCPAREEVREYAARLTAASLDGLEVRSVVLEACGQLGAIHQHHHEKTDAVWSPAAARLLSVCCCAACARGWAARGADPDETRALLRAEVRRLIGTGDLAATEDELAPELRRILLETRQDGVDRLRSEVLAAASGAERIVLHGSTDPWTTGALPGLTPRAAGEVDAVVLPCWQSSGLGEVAEASTSFPENTGVGAYVTAVGPQLGDVADYVGRLKSAGATELHLYHLGLAGPARLPALRAASDAAHRP